MAFTRVVGPGIHTQANVHSHNIQSTGIITATKFDGPFDSLTVSGNLSIGGTLTYEDVTNIDSVGVVTARNGLKVTGGTSFFAGAIAAAGWTYFAKLDKDTPRMLMELFYVLFSLWGVYNWI